MKNDLLTEPVIHVAVPFGQGDHEHCGGLNETVVDPLIIMLDAVAEKEHRDREARRGTKKMLLNLCIVLGFVLGILWYVPMSYQGPGSIQLLRIFLHT